MRIKDLREAAWNPRSITSEELNTLKASLEAFGDLGGVIYNRRTGNLVGGHQRIKVFRETEGETEIVLEKEYAVPTPQGTVAVGYFCRGDERFSYREVDWDEDKEKMANLAANRISGSWELTKLEDLLDGLTKGHADLTELANTGFSAEFLTQYVGGESLFQLLGIEMVKRLNEPLNAVDGVGAVGDSAEDVDVSGPEVHLPDEKDYDENLPTDITCPKCGYKFS